ncbi:serine/threonine protein kinase [Diaminobutyricibacter tongyongensis]|uniref:non-specific serine/threonine protein kinase n=1 Tax=Leifsonia tongyongensis TaxID=1268043 RepID=A0A6L9XWP4_9MICO|nr:serine/threonine-protein kinase [Diaminobutyricibacter tongyongensis]NEN05793.1 serine/threonine protein kinase [Diaminobutyricibacter tongyongensis]
MDDADKRIGQVLADRYELNDVIGRGGMGSVFRAWDTHLERFVAIKVFAPGTASDDGRRHAEGNLLARLNHPNLVTLHDAHLAPADSETPSFLVMELVDGPDLRAELEKGPLSGEVSAQIAYEIAEALVAVHSLGIVHRDLKPANILLAPTGLPSPAYHAKLADFGIAHLLGEERMTTVGLVIGTAGYLSPEQATGGEPGPETDVYALGLVVLECLTGVKAYPGNAVEAVSARLTRDPAIPEDLPVAWASLLGQMTARDPAMRPNSLEVAVTTREIAEELNGWGPPGAAAVTESTVAMLPPTLVLPAAADVGPAVDDSAAPTAATVVLGAAPAAAAGVAAGAGVAAAASASPPAARSHRGRIAAIIAGAGALLLALVLGASMLLNAPQAAVPPTRTPSPTSPAPATPSLTPTPTPTPPAKKGDKGNKGPGKDNGNDNGNGNGGD